MHGFQHPHWESPKARDRRIFREEQLQAQDKARTDRKPRVGKRVLHDGTIEHYEALN